MRTSRVVVRTAEALLVAGLLVFVLGQVTGQPLLFAFVETSSMQPTLDPGDGFVAVPGEVAGEVESGDVIVFRAEELHGGGLVTHRVVEVTEQGYITRGDANNVVDQQVGEPPVKEAQVVAHALQVNGEVLVLPQLRILVTGTQSVFETVNLVLEGLFGIGARITLDRLPYVVFALSLLVYGASAWRDGNGRTPARECSRDTGTDVRFIVAILAVLVVITATGTMVLPSGAQQYSLIASETAPQADSSGIVLPGETTTRTHGTANPGLVPTVVYLEPGSSGVSLDRQELYLDGGELATVGLTLRAPSETGYYRYYVREHRYLALLPQPTLRSLYEIHPWVPIVAIDLLIGLPFYLLGVSLVDSGRVRSRDGRDVPPGTTVRRTLRGLYR